MPEMLRRPGLRPAPRWGAYSAPPDPLAVALLLRGGREGTEGGREREGEGREGREGRGGAASSIKGGS